MLENEFIEKIKKEYKKIRYVACPAFDNEKIHFNKYGFNHLLRKGSIQRDSKEQMRRMHLLVLAADVISTSQNIIDHSRSDVKHPPAEFWSLTKEYNDKIIKVIIRKIGNGNKHFFSVMDKTK